MLLDALRQFSGLSFVAVKQMGDTLRNADYGLDGIACDLANGLYLTLYLSRDSLNDHVYVSYLGEFRQRRDLSHAHGQCCYTVCAKFAEAAEDDIVMHEPVRLHRFTDMKVSDSDEFRWQTYQGGLLWRHFEANREGTASDRSRNHCNGL